MNIPRQHHLGDYGKIPEISSVSVCVCASRLASEDSVNCVISDVEQAETYNLNFFQQQLSYFIRFFTRKCTGRNLHG